MPGGRSDGPAGVNDTGHVTNNAKRSRRVAPKDGGATRSGFPMRFGGVEFVVF